MSFTVVAVGLVHWIASPNFCMFHYIFPQFSLRFKLWFQMCSVRNHFKCLQCCSNGTPPPKDPAPAAPRTPLKVTIRRCSTGSVATALVNDPEQVASITGDLLGYSGSICFVRICSVLLVMNYGNIWDIRWLLRTVSVRWLWVFHPDVCSLV